MKKISQATYDQIENYMNSEARPLERALFNNHFNGSSQDEVLDALEAFQNPDGGFGQGIEPDFKLPQSSAMATSIGLRHLSSLDGSDRVQNMIAEAVHYLESTFDSNRNGWYSVPSSVNDHPHAPWWEFRRDMNMTVIDCSWGNPTAELTGYLWKHEKHVRDLDVKSLTMHAIDNLNKRTEFSSEHEILCYIRMYNSVNEELASKMEGALKLAVSQLVNTNQSEWENYVPTPLKFIEHDSKNYFGIEQRCMDENLDYIIDRLEKHGRMLPTWEWGQYPEEWETARIEWTGILTLDAMLSLKKFSRISANAF